MAHMPLKKFSNLSSKIEMVLTYAVGKVPFLIIAVSSMIFGHDIIKLHENLTAFNPSLREMWRHSKFVIGSNVLLSRLWASEYIVGIIRYHQSPDSYFTCNYYLIPCDEFVTNSIFIISGAWSVMTVVYAWASIILYVAKLQARVNDLTRCCKTLVVESGRRIGESRTGYSRNREYTIQTIFCGFQSIKDDSERYYRICGPYALALIICFVFQCISLLSLILSYRSSVLDISDSAFICTGLTSLLSAIAVVCFGGHVTQAVIS